MFTFIFPTSILRGLVLVLMDSNECFGKKLIRNNPNSVQEHELIRLRANKSTFYCRGARSRRHNRLLHPYKSPNPINGPCGRCQQELREPYICCVECDQSFCTHCFAHGAETKTHRSWHSYAIRTDTLQVFAGATNWTVRDERKLLDLLVSHGYGNWDDIARHLQRAHTPDEVRDHYNEHYFDGLFGRICGLGRDVYEPITVPRLYKFKSLQPPRFHMDTPDFRAMSGYRCARGEFDTPYDNSAESIVSNLNLTNWSDDEEELGETLNAAMMLVYNNRLK